MLSLKWDVMYLIFFILPDLGPSETSIPMALPVNPSGPVHFWKLY